MRWVTSRRRLRQAMLRQQMIGEGLFAASKIIQTFSGIPFEPRLAFAPSVCAPRGSARTTYIFLTTIPGLPNDAESTMNQVATRSPTEPPTHPTPRDGDIAY